MKPDIKGRSLLTLNDLSDSEMLDLIDYARELKQAKAAGSKTPEKHLANKNIAMIFEKSSTRTRCATAVGAADEGAGIQYLGKDDIHLGKKESVADTARVLGRMFDGIMFRGFKHQRVTELSNWAGIPVWNGLTDHSHPTQILADLMTIAEHFGDVSGKKLVYLGDGRNNVCNSLMMGCAKAGMNFVNCCPAELEPSPEFIADAQKTASQYGRNIEIINNPKTAVHDANVLYTDVWASMGEEDIFEERRSLLQDYQVNMELLEKTGHTTDNNLIFLHCLPAFHNDMTEYTKDCGALEVTEEVFESEYSHAFAEAENRMHTIKALMVSTLT